VLREKSGVAKKNRITNSTQFKTNLP